MPVQNKNCSLKSIFRYFVIYLLFTVLNCQEVQSDNDPRHQISKKKNQKRNLQSIYLGFDFSFLSSFNDGRTSFEPSNGIFQSGINNKITENKIPTKQIKNPSPTQRLKQQKISNHQFKDITLSHEIPTKFLLNQIYVFKGIAKNLTSTKINVLMILIQDQNVRISKSQSLESNKQFQVYFNMSMSGKFYLTIFTGTIGQSSRTQYEIIQRLPYRNYEIEAPPEIDDLTIFERDNKIVVKWSNLNGIKFPIVKLTFEQYSTMSKVQFLFSNFVDEFILPLRLFYRFEKSTVSLAAVQAESSASSAFSRISQFSITKMIFFDPEQHSFSQNRTDLVQINDFDYIFNPNQGTLSITGKSLSKLKNQVVVLEPSKTFRSYLINNALNDLSQVPTNSNIALTIDISQEGTYIIEINHFTGIAVLNRPVYVGRYIIPIIPDSQDLKDRSKSPAVLVSQQPKNINQQRNLFLSLINQKRRQFGLQEVYLDEKLNELAQLHSEDMVRRKYSSHYTPEGLGPTDRARNLKIFEQIGQNIGQNSDLIDAHNRLCRSNIHLRNIVNPKWTRVGVGIKLNTNNSFLITQQFSTKDLTKNPLTQAQLDSIKIQLIGYVVFVVKSVKSQDISLSQRIAAWHQQKESATSSQLSNFIRTLNYSRYSGVVIKLSYSSEAAQNIKSSPYLIPSSNLYTQVGMSVKFNNSNGFLQVCIGYVS